MSYSFGITADDCSKKDNTLQVLECHNLRYSQADKKLKAIYGAAMKEFTDEQKTKLKDSQRAWLKYRDGNFNLVTEMSKDSGSFGGVMISAFKANVVERRVAELKEVLRGPGDVPDWLK
jgi:uncharacterized protein YecT (DUF1311 family)